jgi:hypothetical protein
MRKYYMPDPTTGGGDKPTIPAAPSNYTPLTPDQRTEWNNFLGYVDQQGLAGSTKLDARDQGIGLGLMQKYKKANPNFSLTPADIARVQYDQYLLRKGDSFNGMTPEQMNYMRKGLNPAYLARPISPVDNWLGSITSKLYYPQARRGDNQGNSYNFGTDVESYVKGLADPQINEKFREKTNN